MRDVSQISKNILVPKFYARNYLKIYSYVNVTHGFPSQCVYSQKHEVLEGITCMSQHVLRHQTVSLSLRTARLHRVLIFPLVHGSASCIHEEVAYCCRLQSELPCDRHLHLLWWSFGLLKNMALSVLALNSINGLVTKDTWKTSKILTKIYMVSYLFYFLFIQILLLFLRVLFTLIILFAHWSLWSCRLILL